MRDPLGHYPQAVDDIQPLRPADAIYAYCIGTRPEKMKYAVCICPEERVFIVFNSNSYPFRKQAELECSPEIMTFLTKDCYLDTGFIVEFSQEHIDEAIQKKLVWELPASQRRRIKEWVPMHGELPGKYEKKIAETF